MSHSIVLGSASASSSFIDSKRDLLSSDNRMKWESSKTFMYLAGTFSASNVNFDIFSGAVDEVPLDWFLLITIFIGIPYMCMDVFIKQYTGKIDLNEYMIPLLRGINCGIMLQSGAWCLVHACDLSEAILYLTTCLAGMPQWLSCSDVDTKTQNCVAMLNLTEICKHKKDIPEKYTSNYIYYKKMFLLDDRSVVIRRIFLIALVWIINFFITTLSEPILIKFFKISFIFRTSLSLLFVVYVGLSTRELLMPALKEMLSQNNHSFIHVFGTTLYPYGVGLVGSYDFGAMSPFTVIDNAVIGYALTFIFSSFLRSLIVKVLFTLVKRCIQIKKIMHYHYFLMSILPVGSIFLQLQRLVMILIFLMMITTLCPHMAAITSTLCKLLHSEFRSVKNVYFSGLLCFFGFILSSILTMDFRAEKIPYIVKTGLYISMTIFAFMRVSIIMYIYGVQTFAADIHFWLGYKPSLYWIVTWSIMPVLLFLATVKSFLILINIKPINITILYRIWVLLSVILVLIITLKTFGKYAANNRLLAVIRPSKKYGPPDADERKRRKRYDETVTVRICAHECIPLDDKFDCNHQPILFGTQGGDVTVESSQMSFNPIFEEQLLRSKPSEIMDVQQLRD